MKISFPPIKHNMQIVGYYILILALVASYKAIGANPTPKAELDSMKYLARYGYLNKTSGPTSSVQSAAAVQTAIGNFQDYAGLPRTGKLDPTTAEFMQKPRCGNRDLGKKDPPNADRREQRQHHHLAESLRRRRRYALEGTKWRRLKLTYRISKYPTSDSLKREQVDKDIERAFKLWSQVANIDFQVAPKKSPNLSSAGQQKVDIYLQFMGDEHGDEEPFDGEGGELARAYFPKHGGEVFFDDHENWTVNSSDGTNLFQVAAHEIGHSLGLAHSNDFKSLMAPIYVKYSPEFALHQDDIEGIQRIYGRRVPTAQEEQDSAQTEKDIANTLGDILLRAGPKGGRILELLNEFLAEKRAKRASLMMQTGPAPSGATPANKTTTPKPATEVEVKESLEKMERNFIRLLKHHPVRLDTDINGEEQQPETNQTTTTTRTTTTTTTTMPTVATSSKPVTGG